MTTAAMPGQSWDTVLAHTSKMSSFTVNEAAASVVSTNNIHEIKKSRGYNF